MDFTVTMVVPAGEEATSKSVVKMYDANGIDMGGEVALDGLASNTTVMVPPGGHVEAREFVPPQVYDQDQSAAVPGDVVTPTPAPDPDAPSGEAAAPPPHVTTKSS